MGVPVKCAACRRLRWGVLITLALMLTAAILHNNLFFHNLRIRTLADDRVQSVKVYDDSSGDSAQLSQEDTDAFLQLFRKVHLAKELPAFVLLNGQQLPEFTVTLSDGKEFDFWLYSLEFSQKEYLYCRLGDIYYFVSDEDRRNYQQMLIVFEELLTFGESMQESYFAPEGETPG